MVKHYWKVVSEENGEYCSAIMSRKAFSLNYQIGKTTKAKIGKIFLFKTREQARNFKRGTDLVILKVQAQGVTEGPSWVPLAYSHNIKRFWKGEVEGRQECPRGTVFANKVKVICKPS